MDKLSKRVYPFRLLLPHSIIQWTQFLSVNVLNRFNPYQDNLGLIDKDVRLNAIGHRIILLRSFRIIVYALIVEKDVLARTQSTINQKLADGLTFTIDDGDNMHLDNRPLISITPTTTQQPPLPYNKYGPKVQFSAQVLHFHNTSSQPQPCKRHRLTESEADDVEAEAYAAEFGFSTDPMSHASHAPADLAPPTVGPTTAILYFPTV
jgi:hypothetical protein